MRRRARPYSFFTASADQRYHKRQRNAKTHRHDRGVQLVYSQKSQVAFHSLIIRFYRSIDILKIKSRRRDTPGRNNYLSSSKLSKPLELNLSKSD